MSATFGTTLPSTQKVVTRLRSNAVNIPSQQLIGNSEENDINRPSLRSDAKVQSRHKFICLRILISTVAHSLDSTHGKTYYTHRYGYTPVCSCQNLMCP